jgi:uncharacterized metal-binding protein YceD (DUF177 family)
MSLQTSGKINLKQLEKQSLEIELLPQEQKWLMRAFAEAAPSAELVGLEPEEWAARVTFSGQMSLQALKPDYMVRGSFTAQVPSACSRCLEPFMAEREGEFQIFIKRLERGDERDPSDDPDYWMVDSDELDLAPIITEQLVVLEPIAESPHTGDDGEPTCSDEGLSTAAAEDVPTTNSPFAALAGFKVNPGKN